MMKNIFLQFTEFYNLTCRYVCIVKERISCLLFLKIKTTSCIPKKKLKLGICVWESMTWLWALESTFPFKTAFRNFFETGQLSKMLCDNATLAVQQFGLNIVSPKFSAALFFLPPGNSFPFWRVFYFFPMIFKTAFDYFPQFKCCVKRASNYFCCINGISVNITEERDRGNLSNGLNLVYAHCYSSFSTNHVRMPHQVLI